MSQQARHNARQAALAHVSMLARAERSQARAETAHLLAMSHVCPERWAQCRAHLLSQGAIALHFHPDRPGAEHPSVVAGLDACGHYLNQFESGLSNGLLDPSPDGRRARWEADLFGPEYARRVQYAERPKYGAWHLWPHSDGPAPRFGSCYLRLKPSVNARATFCWGDSHRQPRVRGTLAEPDALLAAMLIECFERGTVLGAEGLSLASLIEGLSADNPTRWLDGRPGGNLDFYIEAQVHGPVSLSRDVEALVADPSFIGTEMGQRMEGLARRYGFPLHWHPGYRLRPDRVPMDKRGPAMPAVAQQVAELGAQLGQGPWVDAHHLGLALAQSTKNPSAWGHWGEPPEQLMKWLWHLLVMLGR
ncbi:DUF3626 domain-containing protein [Ferrimonas balearica]|uniref:DUF3626 domain-containing protein n=1 Tax=Ferrimonas balearica TaxID=44012 RepID=UPI001C99C548|nr:DUF3626 domain-containing protein [Ferrimonas balearica]MBY5991881.1 DUF3626 domain-containing protein [Ferrimonas balearica]